MFNSFWMTSSIENPAGPTLSALSRRGKALKVVVSKAVPAENLSSASKDTWDVEVSSPDIIDSMSLLTG